MQALLRMLDFGKRVTLGRIFGALAVDEHFEVVLLSVARQWCASSLESLSPMCLWLLPSILVAYT